ncbi:MAG TPA: hypothetical protein VG146_06580 [Verrucomicrobiae bacterium]|nr:hypothetical protein [Verrucomicrobiae bacterium]
MNYFLLLVCFSLVAAPLGARAQSPYLFRMTFRGDCFQTNGAGQFVDIPITQNDILLAAAQAGGTSDISSMALVYHIMGDTTHGDTIDIYSTTTGQKLTTVFGLFFGDAPSLNRTALTNNAATEIRRVDYVYTFNGTTYTYPGGHSMGASLTTKRFSSDARGLVRTTIEGQMEWVVNPINGAGPKVLRATFTTTKPFP